MTSSSDPAPWAHKAHALLLPTPLADRDPDGEASRAQEVRELLQRHDLGVTEWTSDIDAIHERARREAYEAHVPSETTPARRVSNGLRHPLSLKHLSPPSRPFAAQDWPDFLRYLNDVVLTEDSPSKQYTALWRYLMDPKERFGLAHLSGHPTFNDHSLLAHRSATAALVGARLAGSEAALLHLHVGPVQGFIKAARRTHDLALGSYIVAYLSFHAVEALAYRCGPDAILYPDLATLAVYSAALDDPEPTDTARRERALKALRASLPNRFMALVPEGAAEECASAAAKAVSQTWREMASAVRETIRNHTNLPESLNNGEHWLDFDEQIDAHLEIDVAVQSWPPGRSYTEIFTGVRDNLGAQRRLITALPPPGSWVPKCTQCGEREQLGRDTRSMRFWPALRQHLDGFFSGQGSRESRETLDLRDGEALCAVCLTKRFANRWYFGKSSGSPPTGSLLRLDWRKAETDRLLLRFPSVASIATAPVRYALSQSSADPESWNRALKAVHEDKEVNFTPPGNLLPGLGGPERSRLDHLNVDGSWFYETSYEPETTLRDHDTTKDAKAREEACKRLEGPLNKARKELRSLLAALAKEREGQESPGSIHVPPYYAVLTLDVDRMGKWLDGTHERSPKRSDYLSTLSDEARGLSPALHREISRRQSALASDPLYRIVEHDHLGRVIYSGGDDLLAFLPLATLWRCLSALHECFRDDDALGDEITLSAGVSITHWRAPLSQALYLSREAEKEAKRTRDRIVINVDTRSGAPLSAPLGWETLAGLHNLDDLAPPTADKPENKGEATALIRFNTLDQLERELNEFPDTFVGGPKDPLPTWPTEAIRSRVFLHLTGQPPPTPAPPGLLGTIHAMCAPRREKGRSGARCRHADLLDLLHLLRFLAREHDPALPSSTRTDA